VDALEKVTKLVKSPSNGICFCQGTLASASPEINLPTAIRRLKKNIKYVHFRDVKGAVPKFRETWQDNGKTNMWACMRAYYESGIQVVLRPDHVPTLDGETNQNPGYEMLGRLFVLGYIRGLSQSVENEISHNMEFKKKTPGRGRPKKKTGEKEKTPKKPGKRGRPKKSQAEDPSKKQKSETEAQSTPSEDGNEN